MTTNTTIDVRVPAEVLPLLHRHPWPDVAADVLGSGDGSRAETWPRAFTAANGLMRIRVAVHARTRDGLATAAQARGVSLATALRDLILTRCGVDPSTVPIPVRNGHIEAPRPPQPTIAEVSLGAASVVVIRPTSRPERFDEFIAEDRDSRWPSGRARP